MSTLRLRKAGGIIAAPRLLVDGQAGSNPKIRVADHTLGIVEVHPRAIPGMRSGLVSIRYG
jgi:hypothetical protein